MEAGRIYLQACMIQVAKAEKTEVEKPGRSRAEHVPLPGRRELEPFPEPLGATVQPGSKLFYTETLTEKGRNVAGMWQKTGPESLSRSKLKIAKAALRME